MIQELIDHCSSSAILHFLDLSVLPSQDHLNTARLSLRATRRCLSLNEHFMEDVSPHRGVGNLRGYAQGYPQIPVLVPVRTPRTAASQHVRCESNYQLRSVKTSQPQKTALSHVTVVQLAVSLEFSTVQGAVPTSVTLTFMSVSWIHFECLIVNFCQKN